MERARGGYTIIEVLLVMAISAVLFVSAMTVFSGQQAQTSFSQSMEDIRSKIQTYANQVNSGDFNQGQDYSCKVTGGRPVLTPGGSFASNEECIFLGRAVQSVPGSDTLHAYTVLGTRNINGDPTNDVATTILEANPEPALSLNVMSGGKAFVLVDDYQLLYGATVVSSTIAGGSTAYNLVGIYTSGSTSLVLWAYPFNGDSTTVKQSPVTECIEEVAAPCNTASGINTWNLCFQNNAGNRQAKLTVNSGPSGINTQLNFEDCS